MNFEFNDDQQMIREQARRFLTEECSSATVRAVLENPLTESDQSLWQKVLDMGWSGITIPEEFGGLGLGYLELCVITEELGRALAPIPFGSSVVLATEALLLFGDTAQKNQLLPQLVSGDAVGTVAFIDAPTSPVVSKNGLLNGCKCAALDANAATFSIISTQDSLYIVDMHQPGVNVELQPSMDPTRKLSRITFKDAEALVLGAAGEAASQIETLYTRAAVPFAFEQIGGASMALETAVAYANQRFAFGRAIGSFQAVKHLLADMYCSVELARSNGYYAAWALSTDSEQLPLSAAIARVSATEAYTHCAKENPQVHGGMGFTWEVDCHLHYRRSRQLAQVLGSLPGWKNRLIDRLPTAA